MLLEVRACLAKRSHRFAGRDSGPYKDEVGVASRLRHWVRSFAADDCAIGRQAGQLLNVRSALNKPGEGFASGQGRHHQARDVAWGWGRDRPAEQGGVDELTRAEEGQFASTALEES